MSAYWSTRLYFLLITLAITASLLLSFKSKPTIQKSAPQLAQTYQNKVRPYQAPPALVRQKKIDELPPTPLRPAQLSLAAAQTSTAEPYEPEPPLSRWDFTGSQLNLQSLAYFFSESEPSQIFFFTKNGTEVFQPTTSENSFTDPLNSNLTGAQKIFFISSPEVIEQIVSGREQLSNYYAGLRPQISATPPANTAESEAPTDPPTETSNSPEISTSGAPSTPQTEEPPAIKLPEDAFQIVFFKAGLRDNGKALVPVATSPRAALQGPDYSLEAFNHSDEKLMRRHLSRILSLGNGGEVLLQVAQNGYLLDGPGFDFALFENALTIDRSLNIWQEFAAVGVSDSSNPESFRWFQCDPQNSVLIGCLGSVPTAQGGDRFDLAELGLKKIRYIWIKDLGISKNLPSRWPTEGCDLDAVRLYHAYTQ